MDRNMLKNALFDLGVEVMNTFLKPAGVFYLRISPALPQYGRLGPWLHRKVERIEYARDGEPAALRPHLAFLSFLFGLTSYLQFALKYIIVCNIIIITEQQSLRFCSCGLLPNC
ncbi:hypothetical protein AVEN_215494-1 [Araneus ventricosus]|uniref:Uncharacterized protein n=1 Tax=Araneus ventricosus TaxID=182803 RepID=A0A4Y2PV68_ARAVE|nr:hypothetical protein AVEN_215494-1 [Araneus ventricosus]